VDQDLDPTKDYYAALGVQPTADAAALKMAHKRLSIRWHPDRAGGDAEKFKVVQAAWYAVGDASRRSAYDKLRSEYRTGGAGWSETMAGSATGIDNELRRHVIESLMRFQTELDMIIPEAVIKDWKRAVKYTMKTWRRIRGMSEPRRRRPKRSETVNFGFFSVDRKDLFDPRNERI
jgi:curved DNA-binding protein CbpA